MPCAKEWPALGGSFLEGSDRRIPEEMELPHGDFWSVLCGLSYSWTLEVHLHGRVFWSVLFETI